MSQEAGREITWSGEVGLSPMREVAPPGHYEFYCYLARVLESHGRGMVVRKDGWVAVVAYPECVREELGEGGTWVHYNIPRHHTISFPPKDVMVLTPPEGVVGDGVDRFLNTQVPAIGQWIGRDHVLPAVVCSDEVRKLWPPWKMDEECINVCTAMNLIPGVRTRGSCCGHGEDWFSVFFDVSPEHFRWMIILSKTVDRNYGGYGFRVELSHSDMDTPEVGFRLVSDIQENDLRGPGLKGEPAYKAADALADRIRELLQHKPMLKGFSLDINEVPVITP